MDDFEYSVEISDRDWECFFAECEACNLLPPSLARVDESGMSEVDDTGSMAPQRVQRAEDDGPPHCGGSPVERYLGKRGVGGMESVLSGSEEDVHLQSVNMFFERLKNVAEAERRVESCQTRAGNNRVVEAGCCRDGQQSGGGNCCCAARPVDNIGNVNTMKEAEHVSPDADLDETDVFIREEKHTDAGVHVEMVTKAKWREDQNLLFQPDAMNINKPASRQSSPSASVKRKRRKKRRLSCEPPEGAHGYERRVFVRPSDSEEEQHTGRAGTALQLYDNVSPLYFEPHKNVVPLYPGSLPVSKHVNANTFVSQQQCVSQNFHRQGMNNTTNNKPVPVEVKSTTHTMSPGAASDDPPVESGQNDSLSAAESVLTVEAGHSIRDDRTLCQREGESQQTDRCSKNRDLDTKPPKFPTVTVRPSSVEEISNEVTGAKTFDCIDSSPDKGHPSSALTLNIDTVQQTGGHQGVDLAETHLLVNAGAEDAGAEDAAAASEPNLEPQKAADSKRSVFAMSSFWSEMEKLTINDILGLRMISQAAAPVSLPSLRENQENDMFADGDSGFFTQHDESRSQQTNKYAPDAPESVESGSRSVMWESEPVPMSQSNNIYPENMMLISDESQPDLYGSAQKSLRRISKNVSVHNLHALDSESFSTTGKGGLKTVSEGISEKVEDFFPEEQTLLSSSVNDSYRISVTDIFQYLFGGKHSIPSQPATDNTDNATNFYTDGNSVPETYDHFFSDFDTEDFFCPLIAARDQAKDELVPIFACSRSAGRGLQFPEVYDCLFTSSSSDESSESDEEDKRRPVRVVTRFSRKASTSDVTRDVYEDFFTDSDLRQDFFWKATLSFRNVRFPGFTVQKQTPADSLSCEPARQSVRSLRGACYPSNAVGNQDVMFADPLLHHLEERISRQRALQPFTYEDLQTAVTDPRLEASFLPLRQSDMCLVCIAFASWVLKTANPQVGDAWKAVLLANVSALSAIRYLRKYIKSEPGAGEKRPPRPALT